MSISDVMKYVRETPGNTNPAVIKSMVEAEQRDFQIPALQKILEEAKAYSDLKGGYTKTEMQTIFSGELQELTRYQGGNNIISNTKTLWEEINRGENATFSCRVNDTIMKLTPTSTIYDQNGLIFEIGINFTYLQNTDDIVNAFLILSRQSEDSTFFGWYVNTYAEK